MDAQQFDRLTQQLSRALSRRRFGLLFAALVAAGPARRAAAQHCGIGSQDCGPGCGEGGTGACNCYYPETHFCADSNTGQVCQNGYATCPDYAGCIHPAYEECCGPTICSPGHCRVPEQGLCCTPDQELCRSSVQPDRYTCVESWAIPTTCPDGFTYNAEFCECRCAGVRCGQGCCRDDQVCGEDFQCKDEDPCAAERAAGDRRSRAGGVCCNPATQAPCGDVCCPKEETTCCIGPGGHQCCPRGKTCCVGPDATACCDPGEAYCCGGVCCAKHRVCVGTPIGACMEECPDGGAKCGFTCCAAGKICIGPETCADCGPGETPCGGKNCCAEDQVCKNGQCAQECRKGQKRCDDACCNQNQVCKQGRCVKQKKKK